MAFAHHHGVGLHGVHDGDHGPFRRSLKMPVLQGKQLAGSGVRALWGPQWTRLAFPTSIPCPQSTATTGAWPSPQPRRRLAAKGRRPEGSAIAIMAPVAVPKNLRICRGKGYTRSTATTGHRLRRLITAGDITPAPQQSRSFTPVHYEGEPLEGRGPQKEEAAEARASSFAVRRRRRFTCSGVCGDQSRLV
jgi:hypothetical protein